MKSYQTRDRARAVVVAERLEGRQLFAAAAVPLVQAMYNSPEVPATFRPPALAAAAAATGPPAPTAPTAPTPPAVPGTPATPTCTCTCVPNAAGVPVCSCTCHGTSTPPPTGTPGPTPTPSPTEPPPVVPPVVPVASVIRMDAGRGPHTDLKGRTWAKDDGFVGGSVTITPFEVAKTEEDPLYYTRRWGSFDYSVAVPAGTYDVRMHFADPVYDRGGKRQFNVYAENKLVLGRFDVAGAGGIKSAVVKSVVVHVTDGALNLGFRKVKENALLSALEIVPRSPTGWTAVTSAPAAVVEAHSAAVNNKVYVFGGLDAFNRATRASNLYDPDADTWAKAAELPRPITGGAMSADGNTVWLVGGFVGDLASRKPTAEVWKYDVVKDAWTAGPALPKAVAAAALVRLGRKLHLIGGVDAAGNDLTDHLVYDIDRPALGWHTSAPLPTGRHHLGGTQIGGKIYAVGGQQGANGATGNVTNVDVYDWRTNKWTPAAALPRTRSHIGSSTFAGPNGRLYVVGGITNGTNEPGVNADIIEYNPATKKWAHRSWMPGLRNAPVARILSNRFVVTTGATNPGSPQAATWTLLV